MIFECLLFHSIDFCVYLAMAVYFYSFLPVILVWNLYCGRLVIQPNDSIATFMRHLINFVHNFFFLLEQFFLLFSIPSSFFVVGGLAWNAFAALFTR